MYLSRRQRRTRLLLRGLWMGIAGLNLIWAVDLLLRLDLSLLIKIGFGILCAIFFIIKALTNKDDIQKYVWRLDRTLDTKEQISTAWMVSQNRSLTPLNEDLISDADKLNVELKNRISKNGWFLKKELSSLVLMLVILGAILLSGGQAQFQTYQASQAALLPPMKSDPSIAEVFAGGVPGMEGEADGGEQGDQQGSEQGSSAANEISESFQNAGSVLSETPETQDLGEALQQGDLEKAAEEMENLADNFDNLSDETKNSLSEIMETTGESSADFGMQEMAEQFNQAAEAIKEAAEADQGSPANQQAQQEMKDVAKSMKSLSEQLDMMSLFGEEEATGQQSGSGSGSSSGSGGDDPAEVDDSQSEPVERLQGEGETMRLESNNTSDSGLLEPSPPVGEGTSTAQGSFGLIKYEEGTSSAVLAPYTYPLEWQEVISLYFLHGE